MNRTAHGIAVALAATLVAVAPIPAAAQRAALRPADRALVKIVGVRGEDDAVVGTGFFVTDTALVATAAHVVTDARVLIGASAATGETFRLSVRVMDTATDVAILEASGVTPPATIDLAGPLPSVVAGDAVSMSGYSGDEMAQLAPAVSFGHVSRSRADGSMELDAVVNPGQSGGPVLAASGVLLGLVSARSNPTSGVIGVALVRPREEIAAQLARVRVRRDVPPAPELSRLIAARVGMLVLSSLAVPEVETALAAARNPHESAETVLGALAYAEAHDDAALTQALDSHARHLALQYPQLLVLYPSLARIFAHA